MPNIIRIRNLVKETDFSIISGVTFPVDHESYSQNAKRIDMSNLKEYILSGFTGGGGSGGTSGTSGVDGIDGIDGVDGINGTSGTSGQSPCLVLTSNTINIIIVAGTTTTTISPTTTTTLAPTTTTTTSAGGTTTTTTTGAGGTTTTTTSEGETTTTTTTIGGTTTTTTTGVGTTTTTHTPTTTTTTTGIPTLSTIIASGITSYTAASGGYNVNDHGSIISERGVVFNTSSHPTIADFKTVYTGPGTTYFSLWMNGLTPGWFVYYRAYVIYDGALVVYGDELNFSTPNTTTTTTHAPTTTTTHAPTTTTTTTTICVEVNLGYDFSSATVACSAPQNPFRIDTASFSTATNLYQGGSCISPANSGNYSNGSVYRYWTGGSFAGGATSCPTTTTTTPVPTTTTTTTPAPTTTTTTTEYLVFWLDTNNPNYYSATIAHNGGGSWGNNVHVPVTITKEGVLWKTVDTGPDAQFDPQNFKTDTVTDASYSWTDLDVGNITDPLSAGQTYYVYSFIHRSGTVPPDYYEYGTKKIYEHSSPG